MKSRLNKILHVDDNINILKMVKTVMEAIGEVTVLSCNSGQEAVSKANEFMPDLILLDVVMPDMNGPQTLKNLRNILSLSDIPVVFMTGKETSGQDHELDGYGAIGYITKPIAPLFLPNQIAQIWNYYHKDIKAPVQQEGIGYS